MLVAGVPVYHPDARQLMLTKGTAAEVVLRCVEATVRAAFDSDRMLS